MNIKYNVRALDNNNMVTESIFETVNLLDALQKVEEQYRALAPEASTKYIIVSYGNDKQSATSSQDLKRLEKF
ncbi:MAG: hypothetical protein KAJ51_11925 [Thermoplasmata archaeon]|nr:hypothetical protein [Thermoplasmata archaeon]